MSIECYPLCPMRSTAHPFAWRDLPAPRDLRGQASQHPRAEREPDSLPPTRVHRFHECLS